MATYSLILVLGCLGAVACVLENVEDSSINYYDNNSWNENLPASVPTEKQIKEWIKEINKHAVS